MNQKSVTFDWATERGEKWRDRLSGMEAMLAPVDDPLIHALQLDRPCRIADIGCGGGGTALEIQRRAPRGSVVHGYDLSPALVEAARERASDAPSLEFLLADLGTAPPPAEPYDRLVSRFGILFFEDPPAAFGNLLSWLAPAGRIAFAVWGPPAENPWASSLREVLARHLDLPKPDPEAPGPFRYADVDRLIALLDLAGFGDLQVREWRHRLPIGGGLPAAEAARFALEAFSLGEVLADQGAALKETVHRDLTEHCSEHEENGTVLLGASVHLVTGSREAS